MPIVAARRYQQGRASDLPLPLAGARAEPLPTQTFDWIGLAEATPEELAPLASRYGLHPLAVEDALKPTQLPKLEIYGHQLFIVARTAAIEDDEAIAYGQTALFLGRDFLVTVRFGSSRAHNALRERLERNPERLCEGPDFVAHAILDFIVDGYEPIMDALDARVQGLEESAVNVFPEPATIRRIFRLRRTLRRFERIVGPTAEVCDRLVKTELPAVDPGARIFFRDVLDHVRRVLGRTAGLKETLATIVETAGLLETHRQGAITRQLASWAAILAVPTAIAGIYGMNFEYMPELNQKWGYPAVLAAIAVICGGLFWRFRRIGWL
jgi:magnesium transporter